MKQIVTAIAILGTLMLGFGSAAFSQFGSCAVEVKQYASVPYMTGGVGLDERQALEEMGRDYNLKLSFAVAGGKYLGDVKVTIKDTRDQTILEATSDGPWLYTNLPPGSYRIVALTSGQALSKTVTLSGKKQTTADFFWR